MGPNFEKAGVFMPSDKRWVGTWVAAAAPAEGVVGFTNQTIRLNPLLSIRGEPVAEPTALRQAQQLACAKYSAGTTPG
jgi:hypothetical protein